MACPSPSMSVVSESGTESATTILSVRASFSFDGFPVFICFLSIEPIVLNWACNGMFRQKKEAVKEMSLIVFMRQR